MSFEVHPPVDAVATFSGGDTVDVIQLPARTIAIVRVHVTPRNEPTRPTLLFEGDIDLDAERFHIVRMQGRLIPSGRTTSFLSAIIQGVLYVNLENAEYDEEYWLPSVQRMEAQAVSRLGEGRADDLPRPSWPSAPALAAEPREKAQTAHIVPPTERGIDDHDPMTFRR